VGRRSAGAAPSSHYRSVTKHCKALRPISLSGRTVRLQRTLATSEPLGSVSLPPTRPAVWLRFMGAGGWGCLPELQQGPPRCFGSDRKRAGGWGCLPQLLHWPPMCFGSTGRSNDRATPRPTLSSQELWPLVPLHPGRKRTARGACLSHPPALLLGSALWGRVGGAVSPGQRRRPMCMDSDRGGWAGSFSRPTTAATVLWQRRVGGWARQFLEGDNGGQGALATRDAATGLFGEGDPSRGGRLRPKFSAEKSPLLYPTDLGHSCVTPEEAPPAPVGAKAARRHTWWA